MAKVAPCAFICGLYLSIRGIWIFSISGLGSSTTGMGGSALVTLIPDAVVSGGGIGGVISSAWAMPKLPESGETNRAVMIRAAMIFEKIGFNRFLQI